MSVIKLSICIATLNRADFIGATLDSIIEQATDSVEIVVVDGASTDNTKEVIRSRQDRFPRIQYHRQTSNSGVDRDFNLAVALARGEYCWLFSDDDLMRPGAIRKVCEVLHGYIGLVIANAEVRTADLSEILEPQLLPALKNRVYKPSEGNELLADIGQFLSFIGCVIIRKSLWTSREREQYFGSFFIHVGVIFQSPLPDDTVVISEPLISIRYGNAMWRDKYFQIWMFKWPQLIWSFRNYSDWAKQRVCEKEPWRRARILLLQRARGAFSMELYQKWLDPLLQGLGERTVTKLIARFPGRVANLLALVYYSVLIRNPGRHLVLADLKNSSFYVGAVRIPPTKMVQQTHSLTSQSSVK